MNTRNRLALKPESQLGVGGMEPPHRITCVCSHATGSGITITARTLSLPLQRSEYDDPEGCSL